MLWLGICGTPIRQSLLSSPLSLFSAFFLSVHRLRRDDLEDLSVPDTSIPRSSPHRFPEKEISTPLATKNPGPAVPGDGSLQETERILRDDNREAELAPEPQTPHDTLTSASMVVVFGSNLA